MILLNLPTLAGGDGADITTSSGEASGSWITG